MVGGGVPYGLVEDGAIALKDGQIKWVGVRSDTPPAYDTFQATCLDGMLVTPALIDCHTHIVHGGSRATEFQARLEGISYSDIALDGGGILSTVRATREASEAELLAAALVWVDGLLSEGVCLIEIKSGYGLTIEDELKMLRVARSLEMHRPVKIRTTWLAAHALPPEYQGKPDAYIDDIVIPGLKQAAAEGLVHAVDGFCENIGFSAAQIQRVFEAASDLGVPVKLHTEQLSNQRGAALAARFSALSADHLEYLDPNDAPALAAGGTVAVLLPGAFYFLQETKKPPIEALRNAGVTMAVASDCNPGSSPLGSLLLACNMACLFFGLTPEEALTGATRAASQALGVGDDFGTIEAGKRAELAVWNVGDPADLVYRIASPRLARRITPLGTQST
ncbi:MAG: imidazolonepropionase [Pseudomonadota bacterium]